MKGPALPVKLYPYQRRAVRFIEKRNGFAGLFAEMGTGKTIITLSALARGRYRRILVVCPFSVATVWRNEVRKVGLDWDVLILTRGTVAQRAERLRRMPDNPNRTRLVLVNFDSYWRYPNETRHVKNKRKNRMEAKRFPLRALRKYILAWKPDAIVADEVHRLKKHTTKQARFMFELSAQEQVRSRLGLSGTPIANGIEDLFSIYRFIDPQVFGANFNDFTNRYLIKGGYGGHQIIGYRNLHQVERKLARTAFQIDKATALKLPPRVSVPVPVQLDARTRKLYDQVRKDSLAELEVPGPDGLPLHGTVLASIVLTTLIRLQQIAGGAVPVLLPGSGGDPDRTVLTTVGDEKVRVANDLIADALAADKQVVVFCRFTDEIRRLYGSMPHHYKDDGESCFYCGKAVRSSLHLKPMQTAWVDTMSGNPKISGSKERRERVKKDFAAGKIKVLIMQISLGVGMNELVAASVAIFYSTGYSLIDFEQARDRLYRDGQKKRVTEYFLQAERTVDQPIYTALDSKQQVARKVTSLSYAKGLISGPIR